MQAAKEKLEFYNTGIHQGGLGHFMINADFWEWVQWWR